jgi:hypothetical protein
MLGGGIDRQTEGEQGDLISLKNCGGGDTETAR